MMESAKQNTIRSLDKKFNLSVQEGWWIKNKTLFRILDCLLVYIYTHIHIKKRNTSVIKKLNKKNPTK